MNNRIVIPVLLFLVGAAIMVVLAVRLYDNAYCLKSLITSFLTGIIVAGLRDMMRKKKS